ncbi:MAG: hypothetical protein JSU05_12135, partial [Bacteroidetes bacterium]|nr:hypothetical protein [Bacteroidota bacterium]
MKSYFSLLAVILFFCSCQNKHAGKYPYAISDFRPETQLYLSQLISEGTINHESAAWDSLSNILSDDELIDLSNCEHPVLRAFAFSEMISRNRFDYLSTILKHLDDTALV